MAVPVLPRVRRSIHVEDFPQWHGERRVIRFALLQVGHVLSPLLDDFPEWTQVRYHSSQGGSLPSPPAEANQKTNCTAPYTMPALAGQNTTLFPR